MLALILSLGGVAAHAKVNCELHIVENEDSKNGVIIPLAVKSEDEEFTSMVAVQGDIVAHVTYQKFEKSLSVDMALGDIVTSTDNIVFSKRGFASTTMSKGSASKTKVLVTLDCENR